MRNINNTYHKDIMRVANLNLPWEKLSDSNILITGATGLIGSCIVETLMARPNRDYSVFALGRNDVRMSSLFNRYENDTDFYTLIGDVTNPLELNLDFHYIIHAASGAAPIEFVKHPVDVMKANVYGVANLMEYGISHALKRFLYISSGEVYGEGDGRIFTEEYSGYVNSMTPRSCYPSSKRAAETLCASYSTQYGVDVVVARPCHIYGPHFTENDNRVYAQFIRNILHNEDIVMKSTGEQYRSWCYVVDCVAALLHILLKGTNGEAYNIADENSNITIKQLAELVSELGNKKVVVDITEGAEQKGYNTVSKSIFATDKLKALGWKIEGSLEDKLDVVLKECKKQRE